MDLSQEFTSGEVFRAAEFIPLALIQKGENIAKPVDSKSFEEDKKQIGPRIEESDEPSWEMMRYCLNFLKQNSQDWAKRKRSREQGKQRQVRLEKAKRKQVKTQMNLIEKKIQQGIEKN